MREREKERSLSLLFVGNGEANKLQIERKISQKYQFAIGHKIALTISDFISIRQRESERERGGQFAHERGRDGGNET